MYERYIAISIRNNGPDGTNSAIGNYNLGYFYYRLVLEQATFNDHKTQLLLVKSHYEGALRIRSKTYGPTYPETVVAASNLAEVTSLLSGFL
jgi:hypothetical protein